MVYLDTSVLVALHLQEPASEAVDDWYSSVRVPALTTAAWTLAEFASALGVKRRTRQITTREADGAWTSFEAQCAGELHLLDADRATFIEAARLVRADRLGLRAGDALHLAVARQHGVKSVASLDAVMSRAAHKLGIAAIDFGR